jgi:hypothetical protein
MTLTDKSLLKLLINVALIFNNTYPVGYALLWDEPEVLKISDVRTGKTRISEGLNPIYLTLYSTM